MVLMDRTNWSEPFKVTRARVMGSQGVRVSFP